MKLQQSALRVAHNGRSSSAFARRWVGDSFSSSAHSPQVETELYDTSEFAGDFELLDFLQGQHEETYLSVDSSVVTFDLRARGALCSHCLARRSDILLSGVVLAGFAVYTDVITPEEEAKLVRELNPGLKQKPYEGGHWDRAISGYRETERVR